MHVIVVRVFFYRLAAVHLVVIYGPKSRPGPSTRTARHLRQTTTRIRNTLSLLYPASGTTYQEFPLFSTRRPEVSATLVVDAAVRRSAVDFLGILDVDLLVVHPVRNDGVVQSIWLKLLLVFVRRG